jgi:predicted dehydrogenase
MSRALTVAIIGAGRIAGGYDRERLDASPGIFTHAGAYTRDGRFTLKTVFDTDEKKARSFAEEWKVSSVGSGIADLCKEYHDIVSVCTPDQTHAAVIRELIRGRAAKTIFAEKPLALTVREMRDIQRLSEEYEVHVFVNFQRRFDPAHRQLRDMIASKQVDILAVNTIYIKGLDHIGTTLIDTLRFFCGDPNSVLAYNRIFNADIQDYTYEFILYFNTFNATAKTIDTESVDYSYHIFEIDLLMNDKRVVINDNSRRLETRLICDYAYSGVRCIDDRHPTAQETGYAFSMLNSVQYLYEITNGSRPHEENTPKSSIQNKCIIEAVKRSYDQKRRIKVGVNRG